MSNPTPTELLAFLQEHGFLTPRQVQELAGANGTMFADGRALARELLGRNWLTAYQANRLLQGQGGELLLGPYRLLDRLGEGGMGQVFKAYHVNMDRTVAIKIIPKERVSDPVAVSRFYREVRAVAKLSHPNIVIAFEVNQVGKTHFLAMEYVDGIDLARLVQQSGPLSIPKACEYIRQAAIGLQHAHEKGLVHRDIKPGNLMVTRPRPDEPPVIKILDFGLAHFESESTQATRLTQLGKIVGTVDYIAPEQAQDARTADIRADIYSLGCSLFYLLTGKPPFSGDDAVRRIGARVLGDVPSVRKSRPETSSSLERILAKMMARNPADRYQTPGEVAKALELARRAKWTQPRGRYQTPGEVAKALEPHTEKGRQARSRPTSISGRPVAHTAKCQAARPATSESLIAQAMDSTGGAGKPAKGRGMLMGTLIGAAVFGLACLSLGTLAFMGSGGKPDTSRAISKGQTRPETTHETKTISKSSGDTRSTKPNTRPNIKPDAKPDVRRLKDLRSGEQILSWQLIGPFEYDSFDEAYDSVHAVEKEPVQLDKVYDNCKWKAYESTTPEIDVVGATRAAPRADKIGAYYAVSWTNFGGQLVGAPWSIRHVNCGYKSWINRHPLHGVPKIASGETFSLLVGGIPRKDWNEVLIKAIVDPKQAPNRSSETHAFSFLVEGRKDSFGRPISRSPMQYTNQPP